MKFNKDLFKHKWFAYSVATCSAVVLYLLLSHLGLYIKWLGMLYDFVSPVVIGVIIAYILDPFVNITKKYLLKKMKSEKIKHALAVAIVVVVLLLFLALILITLIPQLFDSIVTFVSNINVYVSKLKSIINTITNNSTGKNIDLSRITSELNNTVGKITGFITSNAGSILNKSFSLGAGVFDVVIASIMAIYFQLDQKRLREGLKKFLKLIISEEKYKTSSLFWKKCNQILVKYIAFDIIDGVIIGVLNFIFMLIFGMPYAVLISVVVGVTNLAPTFGPILGGVIGGFVLLLVDPGKALGFIIFTIILQTVDGYILKPKLFGDTLGVSSVWILISIIVWGRIFGVVGILLAIPVAAILDYIYDNYIIPHLEERKKKKDNLRKSSNNQ